MESLIFEYLMVFGILVVLEGLLSADNALVLAILVKHLPEEQEKKALLYGLVGAFIFRFTALFLISYLANIWQAQAIGALYLLYICVKNLRDIKKHKDDSPELKPQHETAGSKKEFWLTVLKVELTDIAFAIDSILAAVAMAISLPPTGLGHIGGLDTGIFVVIFCGGFVGLIIMRFAAMIFINLLHKRPGLEKAAFLIVGWVGVKLILTTLAHPSLAFIPHSVPEATWFKILFFVVMFAIALWGWFSEKPKDNSQPPATV